MGLDKDTRDRAESFREQRLACVSDLAHDRRRILEPERLGFAAFSYVLGNFVAFGVVCAFVYSMTLLPALLSILPLRAPRRMPSDKSLPFFDRFGAFVVRTPHASALVHRLF